ncbi:FAD binding domain-containing protein [Pseudomassariella vexata]|uniref:FAD binding domain-containing protein n=1 Tax=Pseudomassariella vexata TaxID=1141098 RepID=A0A1Y2DR70_9PEZI|nr:FAD binding domain-containing protein [Pseudomassariella vexata]ORY61761.1 FAD binding domain-containing protein [Pseudomassariella vexata]
MSYLLSKFGVQSLLIEKYPERLAAPKAHALCPRSLEICRQFGLDTTALRKMGTRRKDAYWVNFLTNLSGERIGVLPYERMDIEVMDETPEMIHNVAQPDFEKFIASHLMYDSNVEVRKGVAFVSCRQENGVVTSTLEECHTKHQYTVRSRHVVGCDGAKSQVRNDLGIESEGEDSYETMMTIHFNADLRPVVKDRVGMLHWITDPACSGFIIAYDLSENQVLINNFDPKRHPVGSWNADLARKVVAAAIGHDVPFNVLSYRPWVLSRRVANQYHVGNVLLAGDAAHSFPPTGGLGLNSGIADVHNLAYKIASVHQGRAGQRILESYVEERRQIALVNSGQSVENGKKIFSFLNTLGTAGIEDIEEARGNLHKSIHDPAKQDLIKGQVEGQREHFDNLEIHIGYVYGSKHAPSNASHYTPKLIPGARLPHAWIKLHDPTQIPDFKPVDVSYVEEWSNDEIFARTASTLDLCHFNSFTVVVGSRDDWGRRYEELQDLLRGRHIQVHLYALDADFEFVFEKHRMLFKQGSNMMRGGAILVRPDQHILAIVEPRASAAEILLVLLKHLCML